MTLHESFIKSFYEMKEQIVQRHEQQIYTAMGFTSNLDLLCDFKVEILNDLLEKNMQGKDLKSMRPAKMIRTMEELLETMVFYTTQGIGGEVDIEDPELIKNHFPYKNGMGGTAVQAAMALSQVKGDCIVHMTDDSLEVCELLNLPSIFIVNDKEEIVDSMQARRVHPQEVHVIIQFKKGDVVKLGDQEMMIPCSNRLILTKNTINEFLPFWEPYFKWIENHAKQVSSNVLSSFNAILDPKILLERIKYLKKHTEIYHANNPDGIVYFEDAHYHDAVVHNICVENLYPYVDIVGMNEEELQYTLKEMFSFSVDIDDVISCIEGVKFLIDKFKIKKGIVVHTKDYAMYVGDSTGFDIRKGFVFGLTMASAKAAYGNYGSEEQMDEILKLDFSEKGLYNLQVIAESKYADQVILVPTRYMDKPKYTIGLGDSFTGGVQMCF